MVDGFGQAHEGHFFLFLQASFGVSITLIDQLVKFLIFGIAIASVVKGAAKWAIGVGLAVEVVPSHLPRLAVHFL